MHTCRSLLSCPSDLRTCNKNRHTWYITYIYYFTVYLGGVVPHVPMVPSTC